MAKSKDPSDGAPLSGTSVPSGWGSFQRQMEDAYISYWRTLREVQAAAAERTDQARAKLLSGLQEMRQDTQQQWRDSYANYLRALQDLQREFEDARQGYASASAGPANTFSGAAPADSYQQLALQMQDLQKRAEEAYRACGTAISEAYSRDVPGRVEEMYRAYFEAAREAGIDAMRRGRDAYRDHLRAIKNTWSGLDLDAALEGSGAGAMP